MYLPVLFIITLLFSDANGSVLVQNVNKVKVFFFSLRKYILESKCKARAWAGNLLFVKKNDTGVLIEHTSSNS